MSLDDKKVHVARLSWEGVKITHLVLPPYEAADLTNIAAPGSVAIGYYGQKGAAIQGVNGRTLSIDVSPGEIGLTGPYPIRWLRLRQRAEVVEVSASRELRAEVAAEMGAERFCSLDDLRGQHDPLVWAIMSRLRAGASGNATLTDVERDELVRRLYARVFHVVFNVPEPKAPGLDPLRFKRVVGFIESQLHGRLSLAALARSAALSPFHFARAFKLATGWAPHQFVTLRRLERARHLLLRNDRTVEEIATSVGFVNTSHFRRLFRAHLGALPSALRGGRLLPTDSRR